MTYVFIRHDKKAFANGRGLPKFDPPLDFSEKSPHLELFKNIVPTKIFSSPFLRCRQTVYANFPKSEVFIIPEIGEYLGNWKNIKESDFDPDTYKNMKNSTLIYLNLANA